MINNPAERAAAVERHTKAVAALEQFVGTHRQLLDYLRGLTDEVNAAAAQLEEFARASKQPLGPVVLGKEVRRVDAERALTALGQQQFVDIGGTLDVVPKLSIAQVQRAVASGKLDPTLAVTLINVSQNIVVPEPYRTP